MIDRHQHIAMENSGFIWLSYRFHKFFISWGNSIFWFPIWSKLSRTTYWCQFIKTFSAWSFLSLSCSFPHVGFWNAVAYASSITSLQFSRYCLCVPRGGFTFTLPVPSYPFSEAICFWVVKGGSQIVDTQQVFKVIEKGFPKFPFLVMQ